MLRGPTRAGRLLAPPIRMAVAARGVSGESSNAYLQFEPKAQVTSPRTLLVLHGMLGGRVLESGPGIGENTPLTDYPRTPGA